MTSTKKDRSGKKISKVSREKALEGGIGSDIRRGKPVLVGSNPMTGNQPSTEIKPEGDLFDFLGSGEATGSEPIRAVKGVLSSSADSGFLSRYSDLSDSDIRQISFLETYAYMVKEVFGVNVDWIGMWTRLIKEHKVSKARKGREEIVKVLTAEYEAQKQQDSMLRRLMGAPR